VWPSPEITVAKEIPDEIARLIVEAKKGHAIGAETAALLAARTALIRMLRDQGCSSFKELVDKHKLTPLLYGQADEIRLWGNVIGHEDVPADTPKAQDVEQLLAYLDEVLEMLYVQPARLQELREKRSKLR
jgi:hypothetical protein